jgi:hypothetical protein
VGSRCQESAEGKKASRTHIVKGDMGDEYGAQPKHVFKAAQGKALGIWKYRRRRLCTHGAGQNMLPEYGASVGLLR